MDSERMNKSNREAVWQLKEILTEQDAGKTLEEALLKAPDTRLLILLGAISRLEKAVMHELNKRV